MPKPYNKHRLLKKDELVQAGDQWFDTRIQAWRTRRYACIQTPGMKYRRKLSAVELTNIDPGKGYRLLKPDERVVDGDEYLSENGWSHTLFSIGRPASGRNSYLYRRAIRKSPKKETQKKLPPAAGSPVPESQRGDPNLPPTPRGTRYGCPLPPSKQAGVDGTQNPVRDWGGSRPRAGRPTAGRKPTTVRLSAKNKGDIAKHAKIHAMTLSDAVNAAIEHFISV